MGKEMYGEKDVKKENKKITKIFKGQEKGRVGKMVK